MDFDQFWKIVDKGKRSSEPEVVVTGALEKLPPEEIISYQRLFDTAFARAYRWDLWGAAYLMEGGCSDDGFIDFRYGLIAKGREVYENALANPDSLADLSGNEVSNELFGYAALEAYETRTDNQMPRTGTDQLDAPMGEEWDFDDPAEMAKRFPKLYRKFGEAV